MGQLHFFPLITMESVIQRHAILFKDTVRMEAYKKAIEEVVKPDDVVLDIGCGLGILSFLALKAGARRIHAVEIEPETIRLARLIARHNGLDKKITFHKGLSSKLKLKEQADVVIAELFGNLGLNENILPVITDARDRLLKKDGKIIPVGLTLWLAPCEHKDWDYTAKFLHSAYGFDMLPDIPEIDLGVPSVIIKNSELLADPNVFTEVKFAEAQSHTVTNECHFEIARDGVLTGFAGWFDAHLTDKVSFTTTPSGLTTHWKQALLPLRSPQSVQAGSQIKLTLEIAHDTAGLNSIISYHYEIKS